MLLCCFALIGKYYFSTLVDVTFFGSIAYTVDACSSVSLMHALILILMFIIESNYLIKENNISNLLDDLAKKISKRKKPLK